jgi:hypothetical protein
VPVDPNETEQMRRDRLAEARQKLLDASAILEALRPQASLGDPKDRTHIRDAYRKALAEFSEACKAWLEAT